jgi:prolyl-tRNA editing enzyme YbaK/EbsC (Cys-tRNA(Pro) deacylase)
MNAIERVRAYLQERNPRLSIIEFEVDTSTAPLAAQALGTEVGQIAKSILLKSKDNQFVMVVTAGDARIDNKAIKNLVGSRMRMATGEEVFEITGFNIGGVCPFALKQDIPIYLDESLKRYQVVYAAAGGSNTALPITYQELLDITNGCPCNVCQAG